MKTFKRTISAFFGGLLLTSISVAANAVPVNVTFSTGVLGGTLGASGDGWSLSFVVDDVSDPLNASTASRTWVTGDIVGDVTGTLTSGYTATYGTDVGAGGFSLTTDAGGAIVSATFSDFDSGDNSDSLGGVAPLHGLDLVFSDNLFFILGTRTDTAGLGWTIEVDQQQGGGPVPEPGILAMFGFGLVGLAVASRRRKCKPT